MQNYSQQQPCGGQGACKSRSPVALFMLLQGTWTQRIVLLQPRPPQLAKDQVESSVARRTRKRPKDLGVAYYRSLDPLGEGIGCGSKSRYQNGTLVSGNMDQNLCNLSCSILSHTQLAFDWHQVTQAAQHFFPLALSQTPSFCNKRCAYLKLNMPFPSGGSPVFSNQTLFLDFNLFPKRNN